MKILNQFCILSILFISTLAYTDSIHGKQQVLNNKNINIDNNKFNQAKLYIKDGVIEFKSIEYNRIFPAYRFNKDPIKIETYEAIFLDANEKQIFQVNIGNPLLVKAQHIGYEDSDYFYGYDNEATFYVPFPKNIKPASVVIYRDLLQTKEKVQKISLK
jgi:hypothetical protein